MNDPGLDGAYSISLGPYFLSVRILQAQTAMIM